MELVPQPDAAVQTAVRDALNRAGIDLRDEPEAYRSRWRAAGLVEAAARAPTPQRPGTRPYSSALPPRSIRGATRA